MSKKQETKKIQEMKQKISELKIQKEKLNKEAFNWAKKRNKINSQFKILQLKMFELKNERDTLNEKVKDMKQKRELGIIRIREINGQIKKAAKKTDLLHMKKPTRSLHIIQKELQRIEWVIQTTALSIPEEKKLVERVIKLNTYLETQRNLKQLKQKIIELRAELKALKTETNYYHEKIMEIARKSQCVHEKMIIRTNKLKELKKKETILNESYLQKIEEKKPIQLEIKKLLYDIKKLKEKLWKKEEAEKRNKEKILRQKLEKHLLEKLKRGEKLTWEEFRLIPKETVSEN